MENISCLFCKNLFISKLKTKKYCSVSCSNKHKYLIRNPFINTETIKHCLVCNTEIEIRTKVDLRKKYCSKSCCSESERRKCGIMKVFNLPTGTVGTIGEMLVGIHLLKLGYETYKPLTSNCSGDLLIEKDGVFTKIEVRTGHKNEITKRMAFPKKGIRSEILAVVFLRTNEIMFLKYPSLEITGL